MRIFFNGVVAFFSILLLLAALVQIQMQRSLAKVPDNCSPPTEICVQHLVEASRWQVPFRNDWEEIARRALDLVKSGDFSASQKQSMLWDLRSAVYSTRSFLRPETPGEQSSILREVDTELHLKKAGDQIESAIADEPHYFWQMAVSACFWGWILFALMGVWKGMLPSGEIIAKTFYPYQILAVCVFASWLFCLSVA